MKSFPLSKLIHFHHLFVEQAIDGVARGAVAAAHAALVLLGVAAQHASKKVNLR